MTEAPAAENAKAAAKETPFCQKEQDAAWVVICGIVIVLSYVALFVFPASEFFQIKFLLSPYVFYLVFLEEMTGSNRLIELVSLPVLFLSGITVQWVGIAIAGLCLRTTAEKRMILTLAFLFIFATINVQLGI